MEPNHIYQYSLLNALMAGVCETGITASDLLTKSCNLGLGTFARMDGELVLLGDKIYRLQAEGRVSEAKATDQVPFVMAINFAPQETRQGLVLHAKGDVDGILHELEANTGNLFIAYRLEGVFEYLKCRTVRGQEYRGQPLSELGKKQSVEEYENVAGTVIGFRSPENWQGFSVAGEHMHFISRDRNQGGHVLEMRAEHGDGLKLEVAVASNVHVDMPTSKDFNDAKLVTDDAGVKQVEG